MTSSSNQKLTSVGLSATSEKMLKVREMVFAEWERRVRAELAEASQLQHAMLVDSLPAFYDLIAEAVTPDHPRLLGTSGSTLAAEHGGERARLTTYDHKSLIGEYQLFRWTIFEVLYREGVNLNSDEVIAINASIDTGIKDAVAAFALAHTELRERLAAALTHDLRSPLATVSNALELILITNDLPRVKVIAGKALDNVNRMDTMLRELLDTMAFHGGQQLSLSLSRFDIYEIVKEIQIDANGQIAQQLQFLGGPVSGWWDRTAMRRAVENLVVNAYKYGRQNSPITIKTDESHNRLLLSVHNIGDPIPLCDQEKIFQAYVRGENAKRGPGQGWGIGLPYVRAVAESHGGSMALDSTEERGTTFLIDIPLDARPFLGSPTLT